MKITISRIAAVMVTAGIVALGATGSASAYEPANRSASAVPTNIKGWQITDGTLFAADLNPSLVKWFTAAPYNNTVTGATVKDKSLGLADLSDIARADLTGAQGHDGVSGYEVIGRIPDANAGGGLQSAKSKCAAGEKVMSGGIKAADPAAVTTHDSFPSDIVRVGPNTPTDPSGLWAATSWTTRYTNTGTGSVQPYLICAKII